MTGIISEHQTDSVLVENCVEMCICSLSNCNTGHGIIYDVLGESTFIKLIPQFPTFLEKIFIIISDALQSQLALYKGWIPAVFGMRTVVLQVGVSCCVMEFQS